MHFDFATATRIVFGAGTITQLRPLAAELGRRALLVTGRSGPRIPPGVLDIVPFAIAGEPTVDEVTAGVALAQRAGCDLVIGLGGGSAIDAAKAIAVLMCNEGEPLDYLEVIGRGQPLTRSGVPCIAVPTTAGTGAEVTRNAVLTARQQHVKVSLRSPLLLPRLALVDPELTHTVPPAETANTGLDALTQLIEPYVSARHNPLTDALCREALPRAAHALPRAYADGQNAEARADMALASLFGGLALANAGLGAVHGLAAPLGGMFPAPHGAVCAALLPHVMAANIAIARATAPEVATRYTEVARLLTGDPAATAEDGAAWVSALCRTLQVAPLATYFVTAADLPLIAEAAARASSMKANPVPLDQEALLEILREALGA